MFDVGLDCENKNKGKLQHAQSTKVKSQRASTVSGFLSANNRQSGGQITRVLEFQLSMQSDKIARRSRFLRLDPQEQHFFGTQNRFLLDP